MIAPATLTVDGATALPDAVEERFQDIVEWAEQALFGSIADWMEILGYPVTGDIAPETAVQIDRIVEMCVRAMALNNPRIAEMNEEVR